MLHMHLSLTLVLTSICSQTKAEVSKTEIDHGLRELLHVPDSVSGTFGTQSPYKNPPVELNGSSLDVTLQFEVIDVRNIDEIANTFVVDILLYFAWYVLYHIFPIFNKKHSSFPLIQPFVVELTQ